MRLCGGRRRRNVKVTNPGERERETSEAQRKIDGGYS